MLSSSGTFGPVSGPRRADTPRLLIACEDLVLLEAMARIVSWTRPHWVVEAAQGVEANRRALAERHFDLVVCGIEPRAQCGGDMLRHARTAHPDVLRVAYRTSDACENPELNQAHEVVSWPANVTALIATLDRAVERVRRPKHYESDTPARNAS